ncbi:MAG: ATPase, T2SS/T4P/T4SS family, partial [bacterium]|nr:ATPase, T2SS/T4P/T4SS family [bacterium]
MSGTDHNSEIIKRSELKRLWGKPIGEILCALFGVTAKQIEHALSTQEEKGGRVGELLLAAKQISSTQLAEAIAVQMDLPFLTSINVEEIPDELLNEVPIGFAKQNRILPLGYSSSGNLRLVCVDALDMATQDELRLLLGREIDLEIAAPEVITAAINRAYDRAIRRAESAVAELEEVESTDLRGDLEEEIVDLLDIEGDDEAPIIRLVNSLMSQAVKDRASDIHIEPFERELVVRFRVDGILSEIIKPPKRFQN